MTTEPISEKYVSCSTNKFIIGLFISLFLKRIGLHNSDQMESQNSRTGSSCVLFVDLDTEIQRFQRTC